MFTNKFDGNVKLHHLVARYKKDTSWLNDAEWLMNHPQMKDLLEKRIERHKKDIIEYVTSDNFEALVSKLDI